MFRWSVLSAAATPTVRIGYASWFVLMAGAVALIRASGRGRSRWEPFSLILLACLPPVQMCLVSFFHPEDLVSMGLILGGLALARRGSWGWAGVLIGLAVVSQQFALLVAAPLFVLAPLDRKARLTGCAVLSAALVSLPLVVATSGRVVRSILIGSGNTPSFGGTLLWELHLPGPLFFVFSRLVPIVAAMGIAWWAKGRLGAATLEPIALCSIMALSISLRLVFEQNLFGWYFMAVAVLLLMLEVACGRIRGEFIAWLGLVALAYNPVSWGLVSNWTPWALPLHLALPFTLTLIALLIVATDLFRKRIRIYLVAWLFLATLAFAKFPWHHSEFRGDLPAFFWQIVLVGSAIALAIEPLIKFLREPREAGAFPDETAFRD